MVEINPLYLDGLTYPAKYDRQPWRHILTEGVLSAEALQVTQSDTPAMSVKVAAGFALVQNDESTRFGHYIIENDAVVTKTIAVSDITNPRIDRVVAQLYDAADIGGSDNKWQIEVLTGTPASSPSPPALPNNALNLALVAVGAGATSIVNADITDQRTRTSSLLFVDLLNAQTIAGIKTFSDTPKMDAVAEKTAGAGVTVDSLLIKDGGLPNLLSSGLLDKTRHINLTPAGAIIPATGGAEQKQVDGTNFSYYVLAFDKTTDEKAHWQFVVPEQYDGGNVTFSIWAKTTVTTGNVMWVIKTIDVADGATLDSALANTITFDAKAVDGTAGDVFVASKAADPGWTAGRYAVVELSRDADNAGDTADADVDVVIIEIKWEVV